MLILLPACLINFFICHSLKFFVCIFFPILQSDQFDVSPESCAKYPLKSDPTTTMLISIFYIKYWNVSL